jgi:hypothetical protein
MQIQMQEVGRKSAALAVFQITVVAECKALTTEYKVPSTGMSAHEAAAVLARRMQARCKRATVTVGDDLVVRITV